MTTITKDRIVFKIAKSFLKERLISKNFNPEMINKYLIPAKLHSLPDYYLRLLESGANRQRSLGVISKPIGGIINLKKILFNFDVKKVTKVYSESDKLLDIIVTSFNLKNSKNKEINKGETGLWYKYCNTIISGATFLNKFKDHHDFYAFVNFFHNDERARNALPLLLKQEIKGFGLALSCDFLKESGFHWYAKTDIHLIEIFSRLGLSKSRIDYDVLNAVIRVADNNKQTPYTIDKIFWLIGSGKLYKDYDPKTGASLKIGRNREKFITYADKILNSIRH